MTAPQDGYVEPPRDLGELRDHMRDVHNLDVAGMLPLRVLLHVHEEDHAEHPHHWSGSPDASRAPLHRPEER